MAGKLSYFYLSTPPPQTPLPPPPDHVITFSLESGVGPGDYLFKSPSAGGSFLDSKLSFIQSLTAYPPQQISFLSQPIFKDQAPQKRERGHMKLLFCEDCPPGLTPLKGSIKVDSFVPFLVFDNLSLYSGLGRSLPHHSCYSQSAVLPIGRPSSPQ